MKTDDIKQIVDSAIRACLPDQAVKRALDKLPDNQRKLILIAIGKAAYRMAQAAIDGGVHLDQGLVITKYDHAEGSLPGVEIMEAGHPVVDHNSIAALTNSNGGLYAALAAEYGDSTDVGAVSILSINDGPFLTMVALGSTSIAEIPFIALVATIVPIGLGFILSNLDPKLAKFLEPATTLLIPFFAFPLGAALGFRNLITAGIPGILLGVICAIATGFGGYIVMKLLKAKNPGVGWAIGTTAGNAVGTPAALLALGVITYAVSTSATGQITAAIIVTAILAPLFTDSFSKKHIKKNPQAVETV